MKWKITKINWKLQLWKNNLNELPKKLFILDKKLIVEEGCNFEVKLHVAWIKDYTSRNISYK